MLFLVAQAASFDVPQNLFDGILIDNLLTVAGPAGEGKECLVDTIFMTTLQCGIEQHSVMMSIQSIFEHIQDIVI